MITLFNVQTLDGKLIDKTIPSDDSLEIDAQGLTLFPGLIDPHVHFRTGLEHKEDWEHAARAALCGGVTTVFDMPNTIPPTITKEFLEEKKKKIDLQLAKIGIPLRYHLYLGADKAHFHEIERSKRAMIALKVFMGSTTGNLVIDDQRSLEEAFRLAALHDCIVAVHAEDEALIHQRTQLFHGFLSVHVHSQIRSREVAYLATEKAIRLSEQFGTKLYLLHIGTKEEVVLIREAKKKGLPVFAETTPHHLFLSEEDYDRLGTLVQVNPPLRTDEDQKALWQAIQQGVIDAIGSDHAPHTLEEKNQPYGAAPSGIPGVETTLPLLLNSGQLTLEKIVTLMKSNIEKIFELSVNEDVVLVDINRVKTLENAQLKTKCGWSPYAGRTLKGWPVMTILKGKVFRYG
jgi:dihydroorotase